MINTSESFSIPTAGATTTFGKISLDRGLLITLAGMIIIFLFLLYRTLGLFPLVMADEYAYTLFSRHAPFSAAPMPSYIYFWIFRQTNHCGDAFLDCARLFNCILLVAAAPFIYKAGRQVTTSGVAAFIAVASICLPVNTYTTYFMPETTYFTGFWILTWFLLSFRGVRPYCYGLVTGFLVACLAMIKVHGLFLLPGVALLLFAVILQSRSQHLSWDLSVALVCLVAALSVTRFGLGYLFAGKAGLHLLGNKYGAVADSSLNTTSLLRFSSLVPYVLAGHVMTLALLFGVPLASVLLLKFPSRRATGDDSVFILKLYTLAIIAPLLLVLAYYTVSVSQQEPIGRMHMRYYSFALPLLLMVAAGDLSKAPHRTKLFITLPISLAIGAFAVSSLSALRRHYSPNLVDSPDVHAVLANPAAMYVVGALALLALAAWVADRRFGAQAFLFGFLPVSLLVSGVVMTHELRFQLHPNTYESAGLLAHSAVAPEDRAHIVVAGTEESELYKTMFQIDNPDTRMIKLSPGEPLAAAMVPSDADWIVIVGDHLPPAGIKVQNGMDGYTLYSRTNVAVRFSQPLRTNVVSSVSGLSGPESIGRWSEGNRVTIEMASPLPRRFQLNLTASAFGPNVGLPFTFHVGSAVQTLRISGSQTDVSLPFDTNGDERKIVIDVPKPTSPAAVGFNADPRQLGILLEQMTITPVAEVTHDDHNPHAEHKP